MAEDREELLARAAAGLELKRRQEEEALRYYRPHAKQREVHASSKRVRAVLGGNRVGKTVIGAVETVLHALGPAAEPYVRSWPESQREWWYARFASMPRRSRDQVWAATVNWDVHRDVTQAEVLRWLPKPEIATIAWRKKGVMDFIELRGGTRIVFKSYETGAEGFQGASLPFVWLDEEPPYDIWNECEKRVMDREGSILLTFTPLHGITWSHDRLYLNAPNDPETQCWHFTWDDNPYLPEAEKRRLLAAMPPDEIEARVHGRYLLPGGGVFRAQPLLELRRALRPGALRPVPEQESTPAPYAFRDVEVEVWDPPAPQVRYVIGVDTAEGLPGGDNSAACVIRADDGTQVAEVATARLEPKEWARLLCHLGMWYNAALLVPERNNHGHAVLAELREQGYPAIYKHRDEANPGWGFPTNARTRPQLVALAQEVVSTAPSLIRSPALVEEMLTFVRGPRGHPEAAGKGTRGGKKDDRVLAFMLAHWGRLWFAPVPSPRAPQPPRDPATDLEGWLRGVYDGDRDARPEGGYARWDPRSFARWPSRPQPTSPVR